MKFAMSIIMIAVLAAFLLSFTMLWPEINYDSTTIQCETKGATSLYKISPDHLTATVWCVDHTGKIVP